MQGNKQTDTITDVSASATPTNDLSYPTADTQTPPEQEAAAVPSQQVGFIPPQELEIKSQPVRPVLTNTEKQRAELVALAKQQTEKKVTPAPAPAMEIQPVTPIIEPTTTPTVKTVPEPIIAEPAPIVNTVPAPTEAIVELQVKPVMKPDQQGQELTALAQTASILEPAKKETTEAELRGQKLVELVQTSPAATPESQDTVPEVTSSLPEQTVATPASGPIVQQNPAQASPTLKPKEEPTKAELQGQKLAELAQTDSKTEQLTPAITTPEITSTEKIQPQEPAKIPKPAPQPKQVQQKLQKLPFAEIEQEPIVITPTSTLEDRISSLEQKIDTLIRTINKWV